MTEPIDLTHKVALVTGGGRGTGRTAALALAEQGAKVCVNDINPDNARAVVEEIEAAGGTAMPFIMSVDNKMGVQSMLMEVVAQWGRLDILVNHANVKPRKPLLDMNEWDWDKTLDVNLKGVFVCSQIAGRMMKEQGTGGVIINLTTETALENRGAYFTTRTGLSGLTVAFAAELYEANIRVSGICHMLNEVTNRDHVPHFTSLNEALLFLLTNEANLLNGQIIEV